MEIRIAPEPFDAGAELDHFSARLRNAGAIVTFCGIVRADGGMTAMEIEHYPGMTEKAVAAIAAEAAVRWNLSDLLVIHRYGHLAVGQTIMMVATASAHRADAFAAAEFLMDYLKSRAPFWKKEYGTAGTSWVAAKDADESALTRWHPSADRP
jgi:molybdopterin synthase catalytic subunit